MASRASKNIAHRLARKMFRLPGKILNKFESKLKKMDDFKRERNINMMKKNGLMRE